MKNMVKKISLDSAIEEIDSWLDYKKIGEKKRETYKENIDVLVDAVSEGHLVLKDDKTLVQTLKFPTDGEMPITELEYQPRIAQKSIAAHMQGVKPNDADGRMCGYIAALTRKSKGILQNLDTEDYSIAQSIAVFFA